MAHTRNVLRVLGSALSSLDCRLRPVGRISQKSLAKRPKSAPQCVAYLCLDGGIAALGHKGASVHLRSICSALRQVGHRVTLHCNRLGGDLAETQSFVDECIEHKVPPALKRLQRELRDFYDCELRIPSEVRQSMINQGALPELSEMFQSKPPRFVLERLSLMGVAGVRACRQNGVVHMLEVNALLSDEAKAFRSLSDYEGARHAEDEVFRDTDHIFCVSSELREQIIARGIEASKVQVLPNGYDSKLFKPRSATVLRRELKLDNAVVFGMVGSLKPWHGVGALLRAFSELRQPQKHALLIVGDGPQAAEIRSFQELHPRLKIVNVGSVPHDQVPAYIAACDVCMAPYEANTAFYFSPLKVYEYMAMAKPVIASDQGQVRELIQHRKNGMLVTAGDAAQLRSAMQLLAGNPAMRQSIGAAARESMKSFTWLHNAKQITKVADQLCR